MLIKFGKTFELEIVLYHGALAQLFTYVCVSDCVTQLTTDHLQLMTTSLQLPITLTDFLFLVSNTFE